MRGLLVVAAGSAPILYVLARRPLLRRLATRYATRRRGEAVLVLVGSLLGTTILTGSLVVGDTLDASLRRQAHTQLGPVDLVVAPFSPGDGPAVAERLASLRHEAVDGVLPAVSAFAACATPDPRPRAVPRCQVLEVDFERAAAMGRGHGMAGPTPTAGRAVLGEDLARRLGVAPGGRIEVVAYGRREAVVVDRVLPRLGIAGFWDGPEGESLNVFVLPGTVGRLAGDAADGPDGPRPMVLVSNRGGVEEGAESTGEALAAVSSTLDGVPADVRPVKRELLDAAQQAGDQFSALLAAMGIFGVVAGILLLVNVFVMLADERRSELGMVRALGMRRAALIGAFSAEGWFYAVVAAALGSLAGVGLGRLIVVALAPLFSGGLERFSLELRFAAAPASLVGGFAAGFVIGLGTVVVTSLRISRLNIIQAIRSLNEPPPPRPLVPLAAIGAALAAAGGFATWRAAVTRGGLPLLLGPILVVAGVLLLTGRRPAGAPPPERRGATTLAAALALAWAAVGFPNLLDTARGDTNPAVFVVQGLVLTGAAVVLLSMNQELVARGVRRVGPSRSLGVHVGLAYPLARRFRTGMILAMFALVIFTLTFISVFRHMFATQAGDLTERVGGNVGVIVQTNPGSTVDLEALVATPGVRAGASLATTAARVAVGEDAEVRTVAMSVFDERWVELGPPDLMDPGPYPDAASAYRAVLADPSLVLVDPFFFGSGGGRFGGASSGAAQLDQLAVGRQLTLVDPLSLRERRVRIAALATGGLAGSGLYYGAPGADALFGRPLPSTRHFLAVAPEADPERVAAEITGAHLTEGVEADAVARLVEQFRTTTLQFLQIIQAYLALGLLVGIAGLAVTMVRAVRERRREIGMLRALGFVSRTVRRAFLIESTFVAAEGVVLGVALALVTSYTLVSSGGDDGPGGPAFVWSVPVGALALLVGGVVVVALLATLVPAQAASRIRPAVALRVPD